MFARRRKESPPDSDGPSPWSSEANAPDAPPLTWETSSSPAWAEPAPGEHDESPEEPGAADDGPTPPTSRAGVAAAVVAGVLALAGLVWLWPGGSGDGADRAASDDEVETAPTTLVTLPTPTTESDESGEATPDGSDDPGTGGFDDAAAGAGDADGGEGGNAPGDAGPAVRDSVPATTTVELPAELPDFDQPFEVVMATERGLATLSFPSGTLRTTPIDVVGGFDQVIDLSVAPDATLVTGFGTAVIVNRDGSTITEVDLGPYRSGIGIAGWGPIDGETGFTLYGWNETGLPNLITVDGSGVLGDVGVAPVYPAYPTPDGAQLLGDAGGVFRVERDGSASRVADGSLLGYGFGRMLLRQCDDSYRCGLATVDTTTGERTDFESGVETGLPFRLEWSNGASLSPDGTMVAATVPASSGARDIVLHADGESYGADQPGEPFFGRRLAWTPDSRGFFRTVPGTPGEDGGTIRFVGATGDIVEIGDLPAGVTSLGVRPVDRELAVVDELQLGVDVPAGADLALVGVDRGAAVHIDLDRQELATWATPDVGPDPDLFVVDGQLVAVAADGTTAYRSDLGTVVEAREEWTRTLPGPRFDGPDDRLMWRENADGGSFELVPVPFSDRGGRTPWRTVEVGGDDVLGTDGAGGLVYQAGGDVFVSTNAGNERITSGRLIALGAGRVLVLECDASGICRNRLVDVDGVGSDVAGVPGAALPLEQPTMLEGTVSPDGGVVFVRLNPLIENASAFPDSDWAFVDLADDRVSRAPPLDEGTEVVWNDTGTVAVFLSDSLLHVYDGAAGTVTAVPAAGTFDDIVAVPPDFRPVTDR